MTDMARSARRKKKEKCLELLVGSASGCQEHSSISTDGMEILCGILSRCIRLPRVRLSVARYPSHIGNSVIRNHTPGSIETRLRL